MKRLLLLALLLAVPAAAQNPGAVYPPDQVGASAFTGGTITSPLCGPDSASFNEPTFYFCSDRNTGIGNDLGSPIGSPFGAVGGGVSVLSDGSGMTVYKDEIEFYTPIRLDDYVTGASGAYMYQEDNNEIAFGRPGATGMLGGGVGASIHLYNLGGRSVADSEEVEMGWNTTNDTFEFSSQATGTGTARNFLFSGGQVLVPDGTCPTAPSFGFGTDTDTGLSHCADHEFNVLSNGKEVLMAEANGTVTFNFYDNLDVGNELAVQFIGTATGKSMGVKGVGESANRILMSNTSIGTVVAISTAAGTGETQIRFTNDGVNPSGLLFQDATADSVTLSGPLDPSGTKELTLPDLDGTISVTITSGNLTFDPANTTSGNCAAAITDTATGAATTDVISWTFSADPTSTTGYDPSGDLGYIVAYPTADTVNFKFCNKSGSDINPGSVTLNWRIDR